MGFQTNNTDHLIRAQLWSTQLKEFFEHELMGMGYVRMLTDFPDGDVINIPSIGQAEVLDYVEGQPLRYTAMDTGNFPFVIDQYKQSATYITNKFKQDSYLAGQLMAEFAPAQNLAIMKQMETLIMSLGPNGQTASSLNTINGAAHRFVASGTNQVITLKDFARAKYALDKAAVPDQGRVAIVDPSTEFTLNNLVGAQAFTNNPTFEGIVNTGMATGIRYLRNIYGFDVYVSNYLVSGISETINSVSVTNGVANLFFSAAPNAQPFVGAVRQAPTVESEYNKDLQREEFVTIARYGMGLYRPENMVVVISDAVQALA